MMRKWHFCRTKPKWNWNKYIIYTFLHTCIALYTYLQRAYQRRRDEQIWVWQQLVSVWFDLGVEKGRKIVRNFRATAFPLTDDWFIDLIIIFFCWLTQLIVRHHIATHNTFIAAREICPASSFSRFTFVQCCSWLNGLCRKSDHAY